MTGWVSATLAAVAVVLAGLSGAAAAGTVDVGALRLAYDDAVWRGAPIEGGVRFTCLVAAHCETAAFDFTAGTSADGRCRRPEALAEAEALFAADRRAVNIRVAGDLAVVMVESWAGATLDAPAAIFACIERAGAVYRLVSRTEGAAAPRYAGGLAMQLLAGVWAPPLPAAVRVGGLSVAYDGARWEASGDEGDVIVLSCLPPTCDAWGPQVWITAGEAGCAASDEIGWEPAGDAREVVTAAGLRFRVETFWNGCRNWTPPRLKACAVHAGTGYVVETLGSTGCRSAPDVPLAAFTALLDGMRPWR